MIRDCYVRSWYGLDRSMGALWGRSHYIRKTTVEMMQEWLEERSKANEGRFDFNIDKTIALLKDRGFKICAAFDDEIRRRSGFFTAEKKDIQFSVNYGHASFNPIYFPYVPIVDAESFACFISDLFDLIPDIQDMLEAEYPTARKQYIICMIALKAAEKIMPSGTDCSIRPFDQERYEVTVYREDRAPEFRCVSVEELSDIGSLIFKMTGQERIPGV